MAYKISTKIVISTAKLHGQRVRLRKLECINGVESMRGHLRCVIALMHFRYGSGQDSGVRSARGIASVGNDSGLRAIIRRAAKLTGLLW